MSKRTRAKGWMDRGMVCFWMDGLFDSFSGSWGVDARSGELGCIR